ncbi:DUF58 domain-containing protein [Fimbriiglobus ruber]|uniref:DUF58 domain-containing protein n=1 Tax=Fimbriiglobus ruber TaxID=1908690 RepID=A0A225DZT0_9BACT|nr:DUF58 domain-containing protein [Fimbriiglobus ruber]OWK47010.1 hypothetical protein FRUB_00709 [Fimbriiglobus ruber]
MLTARGWWFVAVVGFITLNGVLWAGRYSATVPLIGLTLLVWFAFEWLLFAYRFRACADRIAVTRVLLHGDRPVPAVWAGTKCTVRVTVTSYGTARLPFVHLQDRSPNDVSFAGGVYSLAPGEPISLEYTLRTATPGVLRFEGVSVRIADVAGLFYKRLFIRNPVDCLVLPPLTDDEGRRRANKRFNSLPPPGVHRLRRPGNGSELLDLREYRPGDPPKMIAWKPSARRDKLIIKEFESDVPVRCVLFVDASNGARVGPPGAAPVVRLAGIASGVAQAAAANRDLVGLTVFDEETTAATPPARTRVHTINLLRTLAIAAGRRPDPRHTDADLVARYAHPVAQELYPDLLAKDVNSRPVAMFWLPIVDSGWLWVVMGLLVLSGYLTSRAAWMNAVVGSMRDYVPRSGSPWVNVAVFMLLVLPILCAPSILAGFVWLLHGVRGFFPPRAPMMSRRKQLGALFAGRDGTGPAAVERHQYDDEFFVARATRFLQTHRVDLPIVLHDKNGNYRFRSERKIDVLAGALIRAVGRARDNELYVILADLAELGDDLDPVIRAIGVAKARHHSVLVIVPWPPDVPPPAAVSSDDDGRKGGWPDQHKTVRLGTVVRMVLAHRYQKGFARVRVALARAGATVVRADDGDPVRLILERMDRVRGARTRS